MRCPDCNKFVSFEEDEPEVESLDVSDGTVSAAVRIVNSCAECGTELKEATLEMEEALPAEVVEAHAGEGHELEASSAGESRDVETKGAGRYVQTFYGAVVEYSVICSCTGEEVHAGEMKDFIKASHMDELV